MLMYSTKLSNSLMYENLNKSSIIYQRYCERTRQYFVDKQENIARMTRFVWARNNLYRSSRTDASSFLECVQMQEAALQYKRSFDIYRWRMR